MGTQNRVDGRGVSSKTADTCGKMVPEKRQPPESVRAQTEGLTAPEMEVTAVTNHTLSRRQDIALQYLEIARRELEDAARNRIRYVILGREYGLSFKAIGDALGITESAVRGIVDRHGDA